MLTTVLVHSMGLESREKAGTIELRKVCSTSFGDDYSVGVA